MGNLFTWMAPKAARNDVNVHVVSIIYSPVVETLQIATYRPCPICVSGFLPYLW